MNQEKMKIDNLFKTNLEGYSGVPSDKVWEQIESSLKKEGYFTRVFYRNLKWAALILLLISLSGVAWFVLHAPEQSEYARSFPEKEPITVPDAPLAVPAATRAVTNNAPSSLAPSEAKNLILQSETKPVPEPLLLDKGTPATTGQPVQVDIIPDASWVHSVALQAGEAPFQLQPYRMQAGDRSYLRTFIDNRLLPEQNRFLNAATETGMVQYSDLSPWKKFSLKPSYFCIGVSGGPEYLFNKETVTNSGSGFGFDVYYNKNGFVLKSGVYIARYGDDANYLLNYHRVDSIGYMYAVESFTIDPVNPDSIIYNLKIEGVYDSVFVAEKRVTDAWYSYMQLPLMVGYTCYSSGNLSLDITAGPVLCLLINERRQNPGFPVGENIYRSEVEYTSASWIKTNLHLRASLAMHYRFSPRLRLSIEPNYSYYVNPVIAGSTENFSSPYAIGGRIGLLFKF